MVECPQEDVAVRERGRRDGVFVELAGRNDLQFVFRVEHERLAVFPRHIKQLAGEDRRRTESRARFLNSDFCQLLSGLQVEARHRAAVATDVNFSVFDRWSRDVGAGTLRRPQHVRLRDVSLSAEPNASHRVSASVRGDQDVSLDHG